MSERQAEAESMREEVLRRLQQTHHGLYEHIWAVFYLGEVKLKRGKASEAEELFREALKMAQARWSSDSDDFQMKRLSDSLNSARASSLSKRH